MNCYTNSFHLCGHARNGIQNDHKLSIATVLLGAGTRGISIEDASKVAAKAIVINSSSTQFASLDIHFVLREEELCKTLFNNIEYALLE